MEIKSPKVSVTMASYNSQRFIGEAIQSILNQALFDFELIIVDDCSKDETYKIAKDYERKDSRIRVYKNKSNLGGCETLNKCMKMAKGKYIAVMDNDDWSYPDRLKKQADFLDDHPKVGMVGGVMEIMNENNRVLAVRKYHLSDLEIRKHIFRYSPFSHPLIMIRKSVLESVGYGDCSFAPADDYELYFRIGSKYKLANLADILLKYRVLPGSITHKTTKRMVGTTLKVRRMYRLNNKYHMNFIDYFFSMIMFISVRILPSWAIIKLFNLIRNRKIE